MIRNTFKMKRKPGTVAEYKKRHDEIWPELSKAHSDAGIFDYSIYFDEESLTLFAFQKLTGSERELVERAADVRRLTQKGVRSIDVDDIHRRCRVDLYDRRCDVGQIVVVEGAAVMDRQQIGQERRTREQDARLKRFQRQSAATGRCPLAERKHGAHGYAP